MYDAIILAGGRARRLHGADKPQLEVGGLRLLDRALAAVAGAQRAVVVGPRRAVPVPVVWRREEPAGAGPVAAIAAALDAVTAEQVVVLAADLPGIAPAVPVLLAELAAAGAQADAACLVDGDGHRNYLAAAWRTASLRRAIAGLGDPAGVPARALFAASVDVAVRDPDDWGRDCDTWEELAEARRRWGPEQDTQEDT